MISRFLCRLFPAILCCLAPAVQAVDEYYQFSIPWNHPGVEPFGLMVAAEAAGSLGHVSQEDGRMVFEDGTPARFWGVGIAVAPDFPPESREDAQHFADKLQAYGVNFVRFTGLDYKRVGLFSYFMRTGELDSATMDRVDYFIAQLRERGIYYSLTIHDSSLKARMISGVDANRQKVQHKRYKTVQIFDERVEKIIQGWYTAFFSHTNKYTMLTYASDPANILVTAVNEDSVTNGYLRNDGAYLNDANIELLQQRFNAFLNDKYSDTAKLARAWSKGKKDGLGKNENLETASVRLNTAASLNKLNKARADDIMEFLYHLNAAYSQGIEERLRTLGYRGLFTFTNDFYGFESVRLMSEIGNVVDMHGYFDPPVKSKDKGKGPRTESILNLQLLGLPRGFENKRIRDFDRNFYKFFLSAVEDLPLILTEWNHSGWSDYAYEGPLLMAAYGSLQGYSGVAAHTYLSSNLGYKEPYIGKALATGANPVTMSLFPSLSLAWRSGYIREAITTVPLRVAKNVGESRALDKSAYAKRPLRIGGNSLHEGFTHKLRVRPLDPDRLDIQPVNVAKGSWVADTGEINWTFATPEKTRLIIDAPKFKAAAGQLDSSPAQLGDFRIALEQHGAVTLIALDDQALDTSRSILLTAVSSFRNSNERRRTTTVDRRKVVEVGYHGEAPVLMKRVKGRLLVNSAGRGPARLFSIALDGSQTEIPALADTKASRTQAFTLGTEDSPWYWLQYGSPEAQTTAQEIGSDA